MNYFGFLGRDQQQILDTVTPILNDLLDAHANEDYALFAGHLDKQRAGKIPEKQFLDAAKATNKRLGTCQEKHFLAALRRDDRPMLLWVAKFSNSDNDALISLILDRQDGETVVDWFWVE